MAHKKLLAMSIDSKQEAEDKLAAKELPGGINAVGRGVEIKLMLDSDIQRITQSLRNTLSGKSA